ncbi:hypothetical protein CLV86_2674 [Lacinutrix venerupis]|uniref:Uncharacterized protein n=1 Tax=Lacinutrix venerupis TaxID=1486034 RepID=A0AAC9PWM7_9FLAO|nr:hypothetical protein BWR22_04755 [Lacinutrix venerupis]RLJ61163.1 hypothetical protein CLV86_2674 [Lacinutrix venerupis]
MLNQFRAILFYYKHLAAWSFIVTLLLTIYSPGIISALLTKLFLIGLFYFMISDRNIRKKLKFYKMAGVSNLRLVAILYFIDCFITCSFLILIEGFI